MATVTDICADYATALASCGPGYHDADIADVVAFKTAQPIDPLVLSPEQALSSIIAVGIAAADVRNRQLNVLDFGGGCGFHYLRVATATRTPLRWAIVETQTMVTRATNLAQNYFRAFTTISEAAAALITVDLIHASSSIQYVPDPEAVLKTLVALRPRYILLARLPYWKDPRTVGVQVSSLSHNGIGPMPPNMEDREIKYPVTFMNIQEILRIFDGYDVLLTIDAPSSFYIG